MVTSAAQSDAGDPWRATATRGGATIRGPSPASSDAGSCGTTLDEGGVRELCQQRDELERRMGVLLRQQRVLEQQMAQVPHFQPHPQPAQHYPSLPRATQPAVAVTPHRLRTPPVPPVPGPAELAPGAPIFDLPAAGGPVTPKKASFADPVVVSAAAAVRSPAVTDYSTQAPLPFCDAPGALPELIDALEGLLAELGLENDLADLPDMVDAVNAASEKVRCMRRSAAAMSPPRPPPPPPAAAGVEKADKGREAEVRLLKHRLKKREDEIAALRRVHEGGGGPSPAGARLSPTRRVGVCVVQQQQQRAQSPVPRSPPSCPSPDSAHREAEQRLGVLDTHLQQLDAREAAVLRERDDLLQKRRMTEDGLAQQEKALRRSEDWWHQQKQRQAEQRRQHEEFLHAAAAEGAGEPGCSAPSHRSGSACSVDSIGSGVDLSAYDNVVAESTMQCRRLTDRVQGMLAKLDADLLRVDQQLQDLQQQRTPLVSSRLEAVALLAHLASQRDPSV